MMGVVRQGVSNCISVFFVSWMSMFLVGRIFDFHSIYIKFLDQIQSEEWLLQQCEDDHFFHKMAFHTDVCQQVRVNSEMSPVLYAINGSLAAIKMCGLYDCTSVMSAVYKGGLPVIFCIFLIYILTPSFLIPWINTEYTKHQHRWFEEKCSPLIKNKDGLYRRLGHVDMGADFE